MGREPVKLWSVVVVVVAGVLMMWDSSMAQQSGTDAPITPTRLLIMDRLGQPDTPRSKEARIDLANQATLDASAMLAHGNIHGARFVLRRAVERLKDLNEPLKLKLERQLKELPDD